MKKTAIVIILAGLVLTIFTAITFRTKEKVVEIGSLSITKNQPHYLNWSPLAGVAIMVVGGVILWVSYKKPNSF